jgi:6-phosphogluconolactonase/glucosamine-6-phosphate isomerase/deaminase
VSYYSQAEKQIVLEHIAAVEVVRVCTDSILEKMEALFEKHEIPWDNLVSMLMDSCAVMRGSKNGLEKKIREKAPKMVDIDGDICHHIHNASKKFCQPFQVYEGIIEYLVGIPHA